MIESDLKETVKNQGINFGDLVFEKWHKFWCTYNHVDLVMDDNVMIDNDDREDEILDKWQEVSIDITEDLLQ
ncbi:hypothetical protein HF295_06890 [Hujiaoplasma nucleasis]|uniref:Uncharacterized protein n=1 Tax=Hujiaoplasma nucleasis TaxID=2725268 RepID=A0A7L6N514_9MOLU|nr:hypothetical protein [Hujiaoplasma nucleasis]QLY40582.1 hypothetical protein HF295_06890 [Hujiaoplasma nucleasis]